jgi:hypothetical protein
MAGDSDLDKRLEWDRIRREEEKRKSSLEDLRSIMEESERAKKKSAKDLLRLLV